MNTERKRAREWLENSLQSEYDTVIREAKLTARQEMIASLKARKFYRWEIAEQIGGCEETVKHELNIIYDRISRIV